MTPFTKTVTKTYTPLWVQEHFSVYGDAWICIRKTMTYKANTCFKCENKFQIGDTIGLACFKEVGNKVLCQQCAKEINENNSTPSGG